METFDIAKLASYRENNRIEAKSAKGGLPRSIWETYSAFANTYGGVILLGVKEREDGTFETVGLTPVEAEHLRQDFWNTVSNRSKVSAVLPIESEVEVLEADGGMVLAIHVPRAPRDERPVYINNDLFGGTYRRRGEGDYRCTRQEISAMLRDQGAETMDSKVLDDLTVADFNTDTVRAYRNRFRAARQGSSWTDLDDERFLRAVGAAMVSREDGKLHPTFGGLLMFGNDYDTPDGTGVRDYIHVVDLARGHVCAIDYMLKHRGESVFNLGTGVGYSVLDMVHAFERVTGKKIPYEIVDRRPGDLATVYSSPDKSAELLGWKAEYDLDDMCRDTWAWQSKNPMGYES